MQEQLTTAKNPFLKLVQT